MRNLQEFRGETLLTVLDIKIIRIPCSLEKLLLLSDDTLSRRSLLHARLGPPGGAKGYGAITGGLPSLEDSVVWWINGLLMPEVFVERGKSYYFRVQVRLYIYSLKKVFLMIQAYCFVKLSVSFLTRVSKSC